MERLVAENEKYGAILMEKYGTLDQEATKERQRLFREDWQKEMAKDGMSNGMAQGSGGGGGGGRRRRRSS